MRVFWCVFSPKTVTKRPVSIDLNEIHPKCTRRAVFDKICIEIRAKKTAAGISPAAVFHPDLLPAT